MRSIVIILALAACACSQPIGPAVPATPEPLPLKITLGPAEQDRNYTFFPIRVTNTGTSSVGYARISCDMLSAEGAFLAVGSYAVADLGPGNVDSGEFSVSVPARKIAKTECRASAT